MSSTLPNDAPMDAIQAFIELSQTKRGTNRDVNMQTEEKKRAEEAIIQYMQQRNFEYIQVGDRYLVLKEDTKKAGWSKELFVKGYIMFHRENRNQGSIESNAMAFAEYLDDIRTRGGETRIKLALSKKRPLEAAIRDLQEMGQM